MLQRPRFLAACLGILPALAGCSFEVHFDDSHYACPNDGDCPVGYECRDDFCERLDSADAGVSDVAEQGLDVSSSLLADAALLDAAPDAVPAICTVVDENTGHCYFRVGTSLNWINARNNCAAEGGYLAVITSLAENDVVHTLDDGTIAETWIGATDSASEGDWRWLDGRDFPPSPAPNALGFENWNTGEPNNFNGVEDCALFELGGNGGWDDRDCTRTLSSVCELE